MSIDEGENQCKKSNLLYRHRVNVWVPKTFATSIYSMFCLVVLPMHILFWIKLRYNSLGFLIEFKHITALNLNILRKDNIIFVLLVNTTMCLNSIREPNVLNLKNCM